MFSLDSNVELKKVTIASLITCIYLPSLITFTCYNDLLYSLGKRSSFYIIITIIIAESLKVMLLQVSTVTELSIKKNTHVKNRAGDFLKSVLFLFGVLIAYFIGIILFGAPVLDHHEETMNLSLLLTLLTVYPLVVHSGVEMATQLLLGLKDYNKGTIVEMFVNNAVIAVCGGWLGAVVIPLDWARPWQNWPIPCYLGVIGGYLLSNVLTIIKAILISAASKYSVLDAFVNFIYKGPMSK